MQWTLHALTSARTFCVLPWLIHRALSSSCEGSSHACRQGYALQEDSWDGVAPDGAGGDAVFVDTALCIGAQQADVLQVGLRSAVGGPLSGLRLLLLRPDAETSSLMKVVFSELYFVPHERSMYGFDGWHDAWGSSPWLTSELESLTTYAESSAVPPNMDVVFHLTYPVHARHGDCLGWAVEGTGGLAWSSSSTRGSEVENKLIWQYRRAPSALAGTTMTTGGWREMQLVDGKPVRAQSLRPLLAWWVVTPAWAFLQMPRAHRLHALSESLMHRPQKGSSTSQKMKVDLVKLFSDEQWANTVILEIGSHLGYTTEVLAMLFRTVITVELDAVFADFARGPSGQLPNIIRLLRDSTSPHAFRDLAASNVSVAFIDGSHTYWHVVHDIYNVLQDVDCCLKLLVFHDFCDIGVMHGIREFVEAGVLSLLTTLGESDWWFCNHDGGGAAKWEGMAFYVQGGPSGDLKNAIELVRQSALQRIMRAKQRRRAEQWPSFHSDVGFAPGDDLGPNSAAAVPPLPNASTWLLFDRYGFRAFLSLHLPPKRCKLQSCTRAGVCSKPVQTFGVIVNLVQDLAGQSRFAPGTVQFDLADSLHPASSNILAHVVLDTQQTQCKVLISRQGAENEVLVGVQNSERGVHNALWIANSFR